MARGSAVGEPIVSQARTPEFDAGYDRAFGPDRKPQRGRWVMTPEGLVPADEYTPPTRALDAPLMVGRFYEGVHTLDDGADIGSRAKYKRYCQERGVTAMSDFSDGYYANIHKERKQKARKSRRAVLDRAIYEKFEK